MYIEKTKKDKIKSFCSFALIPTMIFFVVILIPFFVGVYMTFTNTQGVEIVGDFVGLSNYVAAFKDRQFWSSFLVTIKYTIASVILTNLIAFLLAIVVTSGFKGQNFFRAAFFTPNLIGGVVMGFIWQFVFNKVLVFFGQSFNISLFNESWLLDPTKALWALVLVGVWQNSGYMMLIYIAGLNNISDDLIEAAQLDGATSFQILRKIKMPLMLSSFTISLFLTLKNSFMVYDANLSLTKGGPYKMTEMLSMNVYNEAFIKGNYGVGQAKAVILFVIVTIVAVSQVVVMKKKEEGLK